MTGRIEKTVFISYRRTNLPWALAIYQELTHHGYDVFFDYLSIPSGDFENIIVENIKARAHFVVILTPSALERCNEPGDWLRREIETAMDEKRNIIPLMLESFDFGSPSTVKALTGKLESLKKYNGLRLHAEYFFEGMNKLREQFLKVSLDAIVHPISENAKPVTEEHQTAASEATRVEKEELTAQEWFERGFVFDEAENYDESIRCFTEAIILNSDFAKAYTLRGLAYKEKGEPDQAQKDFTDSIRLDPADNGPYVFRGFIHRDNGDYDRAFQDFTEAIKVDSNDSRIYSFRGNLQLEKGNLDEAIDDFTQALLLAPDFANVYSYRAMAWEGKKNYLAAIADYEKYLAFKPDLEDDDREGVEKIIDELKKKVV